MADDDDNAAMRKQIEDLTQNINRLSQQFDEYIGNRLTDAEKPTPRNGVVLSHAEYEYTQDFSKDENEDRGNWTGRLDFLLACLGYAVGLGNVWRFPYLCYKNGGAVFFIPYVIMLFLVGMPIFFLELSLGQYTSSSPLTCWEMAPLFKGIGLGMVVVSSLVGIYYNMIIAWSIFYLFASFTSDLPWQYCDRDWNTEYCSSLLTVGMNQTQCENQALFYNDTIGVCFNTTGVKDVPVAIINETLASSAGIKANLPTEEYLTNYVWHSDEVSGIEENGSIQWRLVLCLLLAWIIVCLSLIKGIKSSGKVVYFTAVFPYVVLIILFVRGLLLDGHGEGIEFYILKPDLDKLKDAQVWKDAAVQIFFSLSASWGGLIALSSYNRFHNDCLRDSVIVSLGNCLTSFFAGFVIFSFLGFLSQELGVPVGDVAKSGVGLAFTVYTLAVTKMPVQALWSILFFLMLITLGLDSEFALVETVTTSIMDQWPELRSHKGKVILTYSAILFLLGLPLCLSSGSYWLTLIDSYAGGWNVLVIALLECLCICYVYGAFRFREDIRTMLGPIGCCCFPWDCCFPYWVIMWCFFTPLGVLFVLIFSWVDYTPLTDGDYEFPLWSNVLGWLMTFTVIAAILLTAVYKIITTPGSLKERIQYLTNPTEFWGPALIKHRRLVKHIPNFVEDPWDEANKGVMQANDIQLEFGNTGEYNPTFDEN